MKNQTSKIKKLIQWLAILLLPLICIATYYQLWYKSPGINSNIFKLQTVIPAHNLDIWAVEFSPDGTLLASGSADSTVKIWYKESGALVSILKHPIGVTYLTFSPDGKFIATAAYDRKARLWKLPEGILVKEFAATRGTLWSVDISPDGKTIAGSGEDADIKLWDIKSGYLVSTLTGHTQNVWDVKFSPDGTQIVSGSFDKTVKIWDAVTGKLLHNLTDHTEAIVSLAFSPDGKILVSTSDDKSIKFWNTINWQLIQSLTTPEHSQASCFSPEGKSLLTGGRDKPAIGEFLQNFFGDSKYNRGVSMRLWDVATGNLLQTFSQHANDVNDVSWSIDGKWIASGSSDRTIELWLLTNSK